MKYKRILLKLSGEALAGDKPSGIDAQRLEQYAQEIKKVVAENIEVAIVIGGGNIFRGVETVGTGIDRVQGDRSEEHTSELQSLTNLVCRLLLEKKKKKKA